MKYTTEHPEAVLAVAGISKQYGARPALGLTKFDIKAAQFCALLGPNGAGKSTLFQMLAGLFAPDQGQIMVDGIDLCNEPAAALGRIGVVFQQQAIDLDLTVRRNLKFHADLHGLTRSTAQQRISAQCDAMGLTAQLDCPARELSGGTRRKVELVRALLHQPKLLLMDEATVGLDPKSRQDLLGAVSRDVRERGSCVLWATHWVEEAIGADRIMLLHQGHLVADGTTAEVTRQLGCETLEQGFIARTSRPG